MYIRRLRWASDILLDLDNANIDIKLITKKSLLRECNSIIIDEQDGLAYLESFFNILFENLKIDFRRVPMLIEHYNAFFNSSRSRINKLEREQSNFISDISTFRKVFKKKSGITVSTISWC